MGNTSDRRPLVTFALIAFNQQEYIGEAVKAALSQTYSPLEIILSDDGSLDSTYDIMRSVACEYKGSHKVILNRNEDNLGIAQHVNRLILELSHGDLIVMAAGDDISVPQRTEVLWQTWRSAHIPTFAVSSGVTLMDEKGATIYDRNLRSSLTDRVYDESPLAFFKHEGRGMWGCATMYHRDVLDKFGPLSIRDAEDRNLLMRARMLGSVQFISSPLVRYRRANSCATLIHAKDPKAHLERVASIQKQINEQLIEDLHVAAGHYLSVIDCSEATIYAKRKVAIADNLINLLQGHFIVRVISWYKCRVFFLSNLDYAFERGPKESWITVLKRCLGSGYFLFH